MASSTGIIRSHEIGRYAKATWQSIPTSLFKGLLVATDFQKASPFLFHALLALVFGLFHASLLGFLALAFIFFDLSTGSLGSSIGFFLGKTSTFCLTFDFSFSFSFSLPFSFPFSFPFSLAFGLAFGLPFRFFFLATFCFGHAFLIGFLCLRLSTLLCFLVFTLCIGGYLSN
jgi:hypothetical protein